MARKRRGAATGLEAAPPRIVAGAAEAPPRGVVPGATVPARGAAGGAEIPPRREAGGAAVSSRRAAGGAAVPSRSAAGGVAGGGAPVEPSNRAAIARDVCLRLLTVRPRTRAELDTALRRRGFDDEVIAEVLDRYTDVGMIDDEAFARAWVTSRHEGRGLARRALAGELHRKGVAPETVGAALGELSGDAEAATARALVDRRLKAERGALRRFAPGAGGAGEQMTARQREEAALVRRLVGLLARKGYPAGLSYRVVKEALEADAETANAAELLDLESCPEE
jgi:regulatory protein